MSKGFIAAVIAWFVKSLFLWLSGYDPYEEINSFLKYVVDFGLFILVFIPIEYFIKRIWIGRNRNRPDDEGIMKKERLSLFFVVALAAALPAANTPAIGKAQLFADVLKPVQTFPDGMVKSDFALMSPAWHPNGELFIRSYLNLIQSEGARKIISETDYGDEKER